jgi:hypothetical protein
MVGPFQSPGQLGGLLYASLRVRGKRPPLFHSWGPSVGSQAVPSGRWHCSNKNTRRPCDGLSFHRAQGGPHAGRTPAVSVLLGHMATRSANRSTLFSFTPGVSSSPGDLAAPACFTLRQIWVRRRRRFPRVEALKVTR